MKGFQLGLLQHSTANKVEQHVKTARTRAMEYITPLLPSLTT